MTASPDHPSPLNQRAATRRGRPSPRPDGGYEPPPLVTETPAGVEVTVIGEDARRRTFTTNGLPLPLWHRPLAHAFAQCTGPHGTLRTTGSAAHVWFALRVFLNSLNSMADKPRTPEKLTTRHLEHYLLERRGAVRPITVAKQLRSVRLVLRQVQPSELLATEVLSWLDRRTPSGRLAPSSGYSEREFDAIMAAARSDVVAIRNRLRNGQRLAQLSEPELAELDEAQRELAATLKGVAATGIVPTIWRSQGLADSPEMHQLAGHLFLRHCDLGPLLTLAVGLSGRNVETIKDLTADHDVLEGEAVRVGLTKRRRGPDNTFETVYWEIGNPSRHLRTPGGFYLLIHQLTQLSRTFSGTASLWSIWTTRNRHVGLFDIGLNQDHGTRAWRRNHDLLADDGEPLIITMPRLKKTVEVRTTRAAGGHLPSSTRSNSMPVLFSNYLRGDESVKEWAADVVTAALTDVEADARFAHARVLASTSSGQPDMSEISPDPSLPHDTARALLAGELETACVACADIDHSPLSGGRRCAVSFLMCLHCQNALVTHAHIPRLKALHEWLLGQRNIIDLETWWRRYGVTWRAITEHIRPKFTPTEWENVPPAADMDELFSLMDGPQEAR
jgi:hypothetical protein